jgi:beta-galactosidase
MKHLITLLLLATIFPPLLLAQPRRVIDLGGTWEIAEGSMDKIPEKFDHRLSVPGLADMASPAFHVVGVKGEKDTLREAFWYRRTFAVEGGIPSVARLKVHKAMYGTRVILNGRLVGDHMPSFTPGYFNIRPFLRGNCEANELLIRVGAARSAIPGMYMDGQDYEKTRYIPGIYDDVELIESGSPSIVGVQVAPDVATGSVLVETRIDNGGRPGIADVHFRIREAVSGTLVAHETFSPLNLHERRETSVRERIAIPAAHLWTPEDPFLYVLELTTGADSTAVRFGVRSFRFDPDRGVALLNEKPYYLRGTNICILRFFEDPDRGALPWDEHWVRKVIRAFKDMHWNSARFCIGFPPEIWYRIADEEGFMVQDEAPIWLGPTQRQRHEMTAGALADEFTEWMNERWNHPSVVIWDAQNESDSWPLTGEVIRTVRGLDLSHRPWDNGWSPRQADTDPVETHTYLFNRRDFRIPQLAVEDGGGVLSDAVPGPRRGAVILNEYGWFWIDRQGMPTVLAADARSFERIRPAITHWTPELYREAYARTLAIETEFFRGRRRLAGVLHFCGLGYSRPGGQTSDNFIDIRKVIFEPHFYRYVREAFAPVGIMVDFWADRVRPGARENLPVHVINDLHTAWTGPVVLRLMRGDTIVVAQSRVLSVPALGEGTVAFTVSFPAVSGDFTLVAEVQGSDGERVHSLRDVVTDESVGQGLSPGDAHRP